VEFTYPEKELSWSGAVPTEYRRTGVKAKSEEDRQEILEQAYNAMDPNNKERWERKQLEHWSDRREGDTKTLFFKLWHCGWTCIGCALPGNPNSAARLKAVKDDGYTIATRPSHTCKKCGPRRTKVIMLRLPRGDKLRYDQFSKKGMKNIMGVLNNYDSYESNQRTKGLLPDHMFPEIRWDKTVAPKNAEEMSPEEIRESFQLMTNRRNQQKREVCRNCYQTGKRGFPFGVKFYYFGDETWDSDIPTEGKAAEAGCFGCGWYDLDKWRQEINQLLG
jgi:hypothetical protein